jgi:hypothetical protein
MTAREGDSRVRFFRPSSFVGLCLVLFAVQSATAGAQPADIPKKDGPREAPAGEPQEPAGEKPADEPPGATQPESGGKPGESPVEAEPGEQPGDAPPESGESMPPPPGESEPPAEEPGLIDEEAAMGPEPGETEETPKPGEGQEPSEPPAEEEQPEDDGWGEEEEDFFAPVADAEIDEPEPPPAGSLTLDSFVRTQEALWIERFNDNPFAKARQNLDADLRYKKPFPVGNSEFGLRLVAGVHLEYDFAYLHERDSYDDPTLDAYEWQILPRETFIALSYEALELTFGSQVVTWGRGTVLSPVDIVNPRDFREPFLVDLEDMRIPILATRLGIFFGQHRLESMLIHESSFWLIPPPMAPFSPMRRLIEEDPAVAALLESKTLQYEDVPGRFVNQALQFLQRWSWSGHGFDLALYAGSVLDRQGVYRLPEPTEFLQDEIAIESWHPRYTMAAHSGSTPVGELVLNWELGVDIDRPINVENPNVDELNLDVERYHQLVGLLGFMWEGIVTDGNLIVEYEQHFVFDNPERDDDLEIEFLFPQEQPRFAFRWTQEFMHERLVLDAMIILFGIWEYTGFVGRAELTYEFIDAWKVGLGYATFQPNDENGPIYGLDSHDRVSAMLRWDFLLE